MHTALRPYMTTGIAIVGASIIAVAPVTVPPPNLAAVEVAAVDAVKAVTADVELTAFIEAFIAAFPQAAVQSLEFVTSTLPNAVLSEIAAGHFAALVPIAFAVATGWPSVPLAPFIDVFINELPLPFGTFDGAVVQGYFLANALPALLTDILTQFAEVIDGVDAPGDLPADLIAAVNIRIQDAWTSFQTIITAFAGALPVGALAAPMGAMPEPQGLEEERSMAMSADVPSVDDPSIVPAGVNSSTGEVAVDTVTVTVDPSATQSTEDVPESTPPAGAGTDEEPEGDDQSNEQSQDSGADDETPNGATDLSDGNLAEPGTTDGEPAGEEDNGTDAGSAGDDADTSTVNADTDSGEDSGDDGGSEE